MKRNITTNLFIGIIFVLTLNTAFNQRLTSSSEIIDFCDRIELEGRVVGALNPDSLPSLPIGIQKEIGGVLYTIAIDSAHFGTQGAFFDAYMAIQLPGGRNKIAFKATNIQFNPKGVVGGALSRLKLVSEQNIEMGPNLNLIVPGDGSNYIEWDCNGFKAINLRGIFKFSRELLEPTDSSLKVKAEFEIYCADLHDILIQTSISPFKIKGSDRFEFSIQEAVIDLSDSKNPANAEFPSQFLETFEGDINLWRGFYLKSIEIKLPKELKKYGDRISIGANNLFIDNSGFSGELFVNNLLSINEGDMSGWSFSVSNLHIDFVCNKLVGGGIAGSVGVPAMDDANFEYVAEIHQNDQGKLDYNFVVSFDDTVTVNALSAKLSFDLGTSLQIQVINDKFLPKLVASGRVTVKKGSTEIKLIRFQNITFETKAPYITNGIFELTPPDNSENKMQRFAVSLEKIQISFSKTAPVLEVLVRMNIGKDPSNSSESGLGISVQGGFRLYASIMNVPIDGESGQMRQIWAIDRFVISDIGIDIATGALTIHGMISFKNNDPKYGDGFAGSLSVKVENVLPEPLVATVFFGKKNGYRYWLFDVSVPLKIPLFGGIILNKIRGGISYHIEDTRTKEQLIAAANQGAYVSNNPYVPNEDIGLSLKAGVGIEWTNDVVMNADMLFSITFNSSGGLNEVYFLGKTYCLVPRSARFSGNNRIEGTMLIYYDNVEKVLDAQVEATANFSDVLMGSLNLHFYLSKNLWYFKLNTPSNPATVSLLNFAYIDTYLMVGQELEPMLPPPPMVMNLIGIENTSSRNQEAILLGNGFAHGSRLSVNGELSLGWDAFAIYGSLDVGAGYDITLYNYGPSAHCEGSSGPIGLKGWYLQGQIYAYIGFALGIRGKILGVSYDLPLLEAQLAMYLAGKLPKPTYVEGGVGVKATLLGVLSVKFHANFSLGDNCNIITG